MPFTPKNWQDSPSTATPLTAAALEDMETRLSDYTDTASGGGHQLVISETEPATPTVPTLWVKLSGPTTLAPIEEWEVFIP